MLQGVLAELIDDRSLVVTRDKGVAFLSAAKSIYNLSDIAYLSINIPRGSAGSFVHCAFTGEMASQAITTKPIPVQRLDHIPFVKAARTPASPSTALTDEQLNAHRSSISALELDPRRSETALIGFSRNEGDTEYDTFEEPQTAELKILGTYFHSHILRRNGIDTSEALVVSARELDCLRWIAAGKSAWEASVILGISERTVRFHLNSAREKLNCTTTTQAVAQVVAQRLIAI
ncbi:hypothetical protein DLM45_03760 [Hyphomicrobium methylovorum]|uniref:helix-turn-helix domain-containing protein n=1 Tax=Hyphomicrobium methylovorum TaxID=84 RepID=UPI0015E64C0A|nr:helix-turn-helix transcriptional regulator [Hyphomicrobium methylovorum]MBA2125340.1 hypothetical protein [Hyphomicrobium methylovorum]